MRKVLRFTIVLSLVLLVVASSITVSASTVEPSSMGGATWLAELLETYGIPTAIASGISAVGVSAGLYLITRGLRKSKTKVDGTLKEVGLTSKEIKSVVNEVNTLRTELIDAKEQIKNVSETIYNERVIPLLNEVKDLQNELTATKQQLNNGALKIINLLTEGFEEEKSEV